MPAEVNRKRRGHAFRPPLSVIKKVPALGATDGQGEDALVHVHYFSASADWYLVELDPETGEGFGWAELFPGGGEWGYMSLSEMESVYISPFGIIERDCFWDVRPLREVLAERARR